VDKVYTDRNYINTSRGEQATINYKVERDGETSIRIFNLNGDRVKEFGHLTLKAGSYTALWDGTNDSGRTVGKGIYFIVVKQPGGQTIRKLVVIK
jgi:flagellar hook assembly protein FlgD